MYKNINILVVIFEKTFFYLRIMSLFDLKLVFVFYNYRLFLYLHLCSEELISQLIFVKFFLNFQIKKENF